MVVNDVNPEQYMTTNMIKLYVDVHISDGQDENASGDLGSLSDPCFLDDSNIDMNISTFQQQIKAMSTEQEREEVFIKSTRQERERVHRIRKARAAAEVIQKSWRKYRNESAEKTIIVISSPT